MYTDECTQVYVDSGYIRLFKNQYMIKTGIVVVNSGFPDVLLCATRFAKNGLTSAFIEACGIRTAYNMFGPNVRYYTDNHTLTDHKYEFFNDISTINLHHEIRWNSNLIIADSIARYGVKNHVNIVKTRKFAIVIRRQRHKQNVYIVARYQYGALLDVEYKTKMDICNLQIPKEISIQDYNNVIDKILTCPINISPVYIF